MSDCGPCGVVCIHSLHVSLLENHFLILNAETRVGGFEAVLKQNAYKMFSIV